MGSERVVAVVVVGGGGGWWWVGGWWVVVVVGAAWGGCEVSAKHAPLVITAAVRCLGNPPLRWEDAR